MGFKKLSKLTAVITAVFMLISALAAAAPVDFRDVPAGHWAEPYITKMALKGIIQGMGNGEYGLGEPLTRVQAVIMLVRILGYTDDTIPDDKPIPSSFKAPYDVPDWAKKYVAVAVEQGIIAGEDLENFRPMENAKRYEVAVFAVRALGLADEAESRATVNLDFTDTYKIPMSARSYVEIAVEQGIINGMGDGRFAPEQNLLREQAAALFSRIDAKLENSLDEKEIRGVLTGVSTADLYSVTVKMPNGIEKTITVNNSTSIYRNGKKALLGDLVIGDSVTLILNSPVSTATYAEFLEATEGDQLEPINDTEKVSGKVKYIDLTTGIIVITGDDDKDEYYKLLDTTLYIANGEAVSASDIKPGQQVELDVKKDSHDVLRVKAQGIDKELRGKVISAMFYGVSEPLITVLTADNERETYYVSEKVSVEKDGQETVLENIKMDDIVDIEVKDSRVVSIKALSCEKTVKGNIKQISYVDEPKMTVVLKDGSEEEFLINEDVDIERNNRNAELKDLRKGDKIVAEVSYNLEKDGYEITEITAESEDRKLEGVIQGISIGEDITITILTEDNEMLSFVVDPNARIRKDGETISVSEISIGFQGAYAEIEVESDVIVEMDVEKRNMQNMITGKVESIVESAEVIVVSYREKINDVWLDARKEIHITDDTVYMKGNSSSKLKYLDVGDTVSVFGKYEAGLFFADLIVIMD